MCSTITYSSPCDATSMRCKKLDIGFAPSANTSAVRPTRFLLSCISTAAQRATCVTAHSFGASVDATQARQVSTSDFQSSCSDSERRTGSGGYSNLSRLAFSLGAPKRHASRPGLTRWRPTRRYSIEKRTVCGIASKHSCISVRYSLSLSSSRFQIVAKRACAYPSLSASDARRIERL